MSSMRADSCLFHMTTKLSSAKIVRSKKGETNIACSKGPKIDPVPESRSKMAELRPEISSLMINYVYFNVN